MLEMNGRPVVGPRSPWQGPGGSDRAEHHTTPQPACTFLAVHNRGRVMVSTQEGTSLCYYCPHLSLGPRQAHTPHGSEGTLTSFPSCRGKLGCRPQPVLPSAGGHVNWVMDSAAWCRLSRCATRPQGCLEVPV